MSDKAQHRAQRRRTQIIYPKHGKKTAHVKDVSCLAGVEGIEPSAYGFGDRRSTS